MGIAIVIGLLAGTVGGMLGIGGGVILIPGMVFLMDVEQHTAQGVSLAVISAMALVGTVTHYRQDSVRLRVALWIIPAAVIFSFVGGMVADVLNALILRQIVGGVIIMVGFFMAFRGWGSGG